MQCADCPAEIDTSGRQWRRKRCHEHATEHRRKYATFNGRRWALANPERQAANQARSSAKRVYGLSDDRAEQAVAARKTGAHCAACGRFAKLDIDHDHVTDKARGLLCRRCNIIAGALEDPEVESVKKYLANPPW